MSSVLKVNTHDWRTRFRFLELETSHKIVTPDTRPPTVGVAPPCDMYRPCLVLFVAFCLLTGLTFALEASRDNVSAKQAPPPKSLALTSNALLSTCYGIECQIEPAYHRLNTRLGQPKRHGSYRDVLKENRARPLSQYVFLPFKLLISCF